MGVKTSLSPNANQQFQITADLGYQLGPNLFHSFGRFNLDKGFEAVFSGPSDVHNILARVTG